MAPRPAFTWPTRQARRPHCPDGIILPFLPWIVSPIRRARLISFAATSRHLTEWINAQNGIRLGIGECTNAAIQPNRITLPIAPHRGVIVALMVIEQFTHIHRLLARKAQRQLEWHTVAIRIGTRNLAGCLPPHKESAGFQVPTGIERATEPEILRLDRQPA